MQVSTLAENVAAISAAFHQVDKDYYDLSYNGPSGGFTELWAICGSVGEAFTKAEAKIEINYGEDFFDWIQAVEGTAAHLHHLLQTNRDLACSVYWVDVCYGIILNNKH